MKSNRGVIVDDRSQVGNEAAVYEKAESQQQLGLKEKYDGTSMELRNTLVKELEFFVPSPVCLRQLITLTGRIENLLRSPVTRLHGTCQYGVTLAVTFSEVTTMGDILPRIECISEVKPVMARTSDSGEVPLRL